MRNDWQSVAVMAFSHWTPRPEKLRVDHRIFAFARRYLSKQTQTRKIGQSLARNCGVKTRYFRAKYHPPTFNPTFRNELQEQRLNLQNSSALLAESKAAGMSHRCEERDPRQDTVSWIHPEVLPDEPFFLIPNPCDCNYEMRYEVVKVDDYMTERLTHYRRAVARQARVNRLLRERQENEANDAAAEGRPVNEDDNAGAAAQSEDEDNDENNDENDNAEVEEQPENERPNEGAAERLRHDRRMRQPAEEPGIARVNLPIPEGNLRHPSIPAAVLEARLANMDRLYNEQRLEDERRRNPGIQNPEQVVQRPVPALEPLPSAANSQDEFEAER